MKQKQPPKRNPIARALAKEFVSLATVERTLNQIPGMADLIESEAAALSAVLDPCAPTAATETEQEFVSLATVERTLNQIPGMADLIESEAAALSAVLDPCAPTAATETEQAASTPRIVKSKRPYNRKRLSKESA